MGTSGVLNRVIGWSGVIGIGSVVFATIFGATGQWLVNLFLLSVVVMFFGMIVDFDMLLSKNNNEVRE